MHIRKGAKAAWNWVAMHPHSLACVALGLLVGVLLKFPKGWVLPDPSASLIGAFAGAAAAVGGALWAANAKQHQEDAKDDRRQKHMATMIAAAIFPEIASAKLNLALIADRLGEAIVEAEGGSLTGLRAILTASRLPSGMCEKFIDRFEVFGSDASQIVEAVGAILDVGSTNASLAEPLMDVGWTVETREVFCLQENKARHYARSLARTVLTIAKYHPRPDEVRGWLLGQN